MESVQQRSLEWHKQRLGKFTASEIHKLMGVRGLGETGKSYAIDKAIEELYGEVEENFVSYDMERGVELEPLAFNKFKELKSLEFLEVENCGFFSGDFHGASPDGLVGDDAVLEIKCPKATTFFKLVADREIDKKYFYQMQHQMMLTARKKAYFFNYFIFEGKEFWHEIVVELDEKICDLIWDRILEAEEIKQEYINKLKENQQWK
jgi:exodeoxyribonuclease (lambda-induced)